MVEGPESPEKQNAQDDECAKVKSLVRIMKFRKIIRARFGRQVKKNQSVTQNRKPVFNKRTVSLVHVCRNIRSGYHPVAGLRIPKSTSQDVIFVKRALPRKDQNRDSGHPHVL